MVSFERYQGSKINKTWWSIGYRGVEDWGGKRGRYEGRISSVAWQMGQWPFLRWGNLKDQLLFEVGERRGSETWSQIHGVEVPLKYLSRDIDDSGTQKRNLGWKFKLWIISMKILIERLLVFDMYFHARNKKKLKNWKSATLFRFIIALRSEHCLWIVSVPLCVRHRFQGKWLTPGLEEGGTS